MSTFLYQLVCLVCSFCNRTFSWHAPAGEPDHLLHVAAEHSLEERAHELTDQEIADLPVYVELQRVRVPRQAETAKELMRQKLLHSVPTASAAVASGQILLNMKESARFDYMRWSIGAFSPWFENMEWEIVDAEPGSAFITTDSPVSFYNPAVLPPSEACIGLAGTITP